MSIKNRTETADIFNVHVTTLDIWLRRGCPFIKEGSKGKEWQLETGDVSDWLRKNDIENITKGLDSTDIDEAKRRKLVADATLAEIEVAREKGLVADLGEIKTELSNMFAEISGRLRRVPERAVLRVVGETNETRIKNILLEEIDECLNTLSENKLG